ncbi:MAG: FTR1 family protein [Candidatus Peregrinibacteria bacterium]|nr:FTR1 family protein [Candidatus Peregrinibacteria bacterium]
MENFIVTFRETLEAALIVSIILGYLSKVNQPKYKKIVYYGVLAGIICSILGAFIFIKLQGDFTGEGKEIFEISTTIIAILLLLTAIYWSFTKINKSKELEDKISEHLSQEKKMGIFFLTFISVLREGIETVVFLGAFNINNQSNFIIGAGLGIIAAIILGYLIIVAAKKIPIRKFFIATTILLSIFVIQMIAHEVEELTEDEETTETLQNS